MGRKDWKDAKDAQDTSGPSIWDWFNPIGPVKLEVIDWITRSYLSALPVIVRRIEAIEQHLEKGLSEGQSFIRLEERPSVGDEALQQLSDGIMRLNQRLDSIEKRLK